MQAAAEAASTADVSSTTDVDSVADVQRAIRSVFLEFDSEGDGKLSADDLVTHLDGIELDTTGDGEIDTAGQSFDRCTISRIVQRFDSDNDGALSVPEFFRMVCAAPRHEEADSGAPETELSRFRHFLLTFARTLSY